MTKIMSPEELEQELRAIGAERYHDKHPFHKLLHGGKLNKGQVQAWALNRYYYQAMIPIKDASLIARCEDAGVRREWRSRLHDHDGEAEGDGGIARWLKLTDGLGLDREYVTSLRGLLQVSWSVSDDRLNVTWDETEGPPVETIGAAGFGTRLLKSALTAFDGKIEVAFLRTGVHCTMQCRIPPE